MHVSYGSVSYDILMLYCVRISTTSMELNAISRLKSVSMYAVVDPAGGVAFTKTEAEAATARKSWFPIRTFRRPL